jgi:predicted nucleic acid-binding protein
MPACLLHSTVIIDAINDRNGRTEFLDSLITAGILLACCPINVTEVHMGMRPHEAVRKDEFLRSLEFFPVNWEIAKYAGELYREWRQKGRTLALADLTIAAVAINNPKDYPMPHLRFYPLPQ